MWTSEFKIFDKDNPLIKKIINCGGEILYRPLGHYSKKGRVYFIATGNQDNPRCFLKLEELKNNSEARRLETLEYENDSFMIITSNTKEEDEIKKVSLFYNPNLIYFNPVKISENGEETFDIGSLKKDDLEKIIETGEKNYRINVYEFKEIRL